MLPVEDRETWRASTCRLGLVDVPLHGAIRDVELLADSRGRKSLGHQTKNAYLSLGQPDWSWRWWAEKPFQTVVASKADGSRSNSAEGSKDAEDELTGRRRGVDCCALTSEHPQTNTLARKVMHDVHKVTETAA